MAVGADVYAVAWSGGFGAAGRPKLEATSRRLDAFARGVPLVHGRPAPPAPPRGPISRVSSSLGLRRPPDPPGQLSPARLTLPLPSTRRNVCPHFGLSGPRGPIPPTAPHVLTVLLRNELNVARCHLRGGVHLEAEYVADVCLSPRFNQCVFYEDELTAL